jgi:alanyl-tRNA synthetase
MNSKQIIDIYIRFFEKRGHKRIDNSPLVPENDPTTLFTSSGMQPLIPYLLGEPHPGGNRLVDVQNCFRAVDIEEVGDNRHSTFFRMLGNWSLGDYFKKDEIPWLWELLTKEYGLPKEKLYITVFAGDNNVAYDQEARNIWSEVLEKSFGKPQDFRISAGGVSSNWWSRSGIPDNMPVDEIGGPDTEVYYRFDDIEHNSKCKGDNPAQCECGKFLEIANSVFMQYIKTENGFKPLPKQNVDFGGGVERILAAVEKKSDIFQTSLLLPIINSIQDESGKAYKEYRREMQIITDHLTAATFIIAAGIRPSKTEQGYVLRRLIRRALDNFRILEGENISFVLEKIAEQYSQTDEILKEKFEEIKNVILEEEQNYQRTITQAQKVLNKSEDQKPITKSMSYEVSVQSNIVKEISADDAFKMYTTHGLSPTQIKSLGYIFNEQDFARLMEEHQKLSRAGAEQKFKGGLADHSELTVMGHTATHLLHKALRDMFGTELHQTGSNITNERVRFDFNFDRMLTPGEIAKLENTVNGKIKENLPVHFEIMPIEKAKQTGAIGLFDDKYAKDVKVYFVGDYSVEFCGGPHVNFTGELKKFKIIKAENIGKGQKRIYAKINSQV